MFPGIDTLIIFVALVCAVLWGVSRCGQKKNDMVMKTASDNLIKDSFDLSPSPSPAASKPIPKPLPKPTTYTAPDQYGITTVAPITTSTPIPLPPRPTAPYTPPVVIQQPNTTIAPVSAAATSYATVPSGSILFVLLNGLNVRVKPDLHAKSLGRLKLYDEVYFANEVTEATSSIHLANGDVVTKPWVKIKTKKGTIGWVHGSGVDFYKRKLGSVK